MTLRSGKKLAKRLVKHAQRYLEQDFETVPQEEERILGDRNTHLVNIIMREISEYNKLVEELKARPVFINRDPIVDVGSVFRNSGTDFVNLAKRQIINRPGPATRSRIRIQNSIYHSNKKFVTKSKNKSRKSRS